MVDFEPGDAVRILKSRLPDLIGKEGRVVFTERDRVRIRLPSQVPFGTADVWEFKKSDVELVQQTTT